MEKQRRQELVDSIRKEAFRNDKYKYRLMMPMEKIGDEEMKSGKVSVFADNISKRVVCVTGKSKRNDPVSKVSAVSFDMKQLPVTKSKNIEVLNIGIAKLHSLFSHPSMEFNLRKGVKSVVIVHFETVDIERKTDTFYTARLYLTGI